MVGVEVLQKNQPYYLPGYTGYCPQNRFICGETYPEASHKLLLDPSVSHAEKLALVDNSKDYEVTRPRKRDIETVNARSDKVYKHRMLAGYDGFVPNMDALRDQPFGAQATKGIAAFERQQLKRKASRECLKKILALQKGSRPVKSLQDQLLLQSKYRLPLTELRPQRIGIEQSYFVDEKYDQSNKCNESPYFMDNSNPHKYFISGYTGHVPNSPKHIGKSFKNMSADGLRDFTSDYLDKKKVEWAPLTIPSKKDEKFVMPMKTYQIHLRDTPLLPNYTGYVPGAKQEVGRTYGYTSKGAYKHLQDQLFALKSRKCYEKVKALK